MKTMSKIAVYTSAMLASLVGLNHMRTNPSADLDTVNLIILGGLIIAFIVTTAGLITTLVSAKRAKDRRKQGFEKAVEILNREI